MASRLILPFVFVLVFALASPGAETLVLPTPDRGCLVSFTDNTGVRHLKAPQWALTLTPLLCPKMGDIPLELLLGWICVESRGELTKRSKLDEAGYFQLGRAERKTLGIDNGLISSDQTYSLDAGITLITNYSRTVTNTYKIHRNSVLHWRMVKFIHTLGFGDVREMIHAMNTEARPINSWSDIESYAKSLSTSN